MCAVNESGRTIIQTKENKALPGFPTPNEQHVLRAGSPEEAVRAGLSGVARVSPGSPSVVITVNVACRTVNVTATD